MTALKLWVRAGYEDTYNDFDDLEGVVEYLGGCGVQTPLERCTIYSFTTDGLEGDNHISLFWGDDDAQPVRKLTEAEAKELNRLLREQS